MSDQQPMTSVASHFVIDRQGKQFVLYAGLLDLAHRQGLRRITTHLLQIPGPENAQTAVVQAEVESDRGIFWGIGDASPSNVARAMLTVTIRLAETRAKARALRDAVNVAMVAVEELNEDADERAMLPADDRSAQSKGTAAQNDAPLPDYRVPQRAVQPPPSPTPASPAASAASGGTGQVTGPQLRAIYSIARGRLGIDEDAIDDRTLAKYGVRPNELTRRQASEIIEALKTAKPK